MHDEDDMERFIAEQRNRMAQERDILDRNPPSAVTEYVLDGSSSRKPQKYIEKDTTDLPQKVIGKPANTLKAKPPTPQILKLGEAYQNQKEKLKEELRQEYRKALAEKQIRTTGVRGKISTTYEQGLANSSKHDFDLGASLPIRDHLSAKERLRLQRNKEYNEFKANKENEREMKKLSPRRLTTYATPVSYPTNPINEMTQTTPQEKTARKNATESYEALLERKRRQEKAYRNDDDDDDVEEKTIYRPKPRRDYEDEDYIRDRKPRYPPRRRRYIDQYDEDEDDESEEELIRRLRAHHAHRRRNRYIPRAADSDEDDDRLFKKIRPKIVDENHEETKRLNSAQNRFPKSNPVLQKQNDLRSKSAPPDQEYTGLPIGAVPNADTIQRKKEEYKLELQKQMQENDKTKRRNKQIERMMDVSGANDVEKKSNRTQEPTPRKKKVERDSSPEEIERKKRGKKRTTFKDDNSSDEDDRRRRLPRQPIPSYFRPPPPPANGYYQMPPAQFPSPYDDAYYYYGSRNPLDPAPSVGLPIAGLHAGFQPGISPLLAAAANKDFRQPDNPENPEESLSPRTRGRNHLRRSEESSLVADETRDKQKKKELMQAYQEELMEQMNFKEKKKRQEKLEQEKYDQKMEMEAMNYNPWGKGGGGAPMRDIHGNLVSDLRQMHLENEDLVRDPTKVAELTKQRQQASQSKDVTFEMSPRQPESSGILSPRFGRSNPFESKETQEQKSQKDVYKDELQRQIEERRRIDAIEKEKRRILEEKEELKREDENRKMQEEYENEKRKQQEKIEEKRRQNEELQRALENKRLEDEQRKREERIEIEAEQRQAKDRELQERLHATKPMSPPIHPPDSHRQLNTQRSVVTNVDPPPSEQVHHPVVEQTVPLRNVHPRTPPVVTRPEKSRESKRITRELSALRKQLLNEQQRIENQLMTSDISQLTTFQPTKVKTEAMVDLSRVRQRPVQVRRPPTVERPNSKALKEFKEMKHRQDDTTSLRLFRIQHPETPGDTETLERQQEDLIKNQLMKIEKLKSNNLEQPHRSRRSPTKSSRNGFSLLPPSDSYASLLDADTVYIPVSDGDNLENQPPDSPVRRTRKISARERRRIARHEDGDAGGLTYRAAADNYSLHSLNSLATLDVERMANKNQDRLDKLKALQGDEISLTDPDDILDRFVNQHRSELPDTPDSLAPNPRKPRKGTSVSAPQNERPSSVNTVDTEPWLRPGTTT